MKRPASASRGLLFPKRFRPLKVAKPLRRRTPIRKPLNQRVKLSCAYCGQPFSRSERFLERGREVFCGSPCARKFFKGEQSANFRGGRDPKRGPGWTRLAAEIRDRDQHTCQRCGLPETENGAALAVDHIVPWRTFTDHAHANDSANLISLCRRCHGWKTSIAEARWLKGDVLAFDQYRQAIRLSSAAGTKS